MEVLLRAAGLAASQHGVVGRGQMYDLGVSRSQVDRWVRSGRIEQLGPSVYGFPGHADSWLRRLWVAQVHAGPESVVSHESAARLHGFPQAPAGRVVVSVVRRHRLPGVEWHRVHDLSPDDVVDFSGLRVTSASRTAFDVAGSFAPARLKHLLQFGVTEGKFTLAEVGVVLGRLRRHGKPGVMALEAGLDALDGRPLSRSELEDHLDKVIALAQLPAPQHEFPLPSLSGDSGFVDRCWEALRWIVEADGRRWHSRRQQMAVDVDRANGAAALGFLTTRLMWEHLVHDPHGTAALLRMIFEDRQRMIGRFS